MHTLSGAPCSGDYESRFHFTTSLSLGATLSALVKRTLEATAKARGQTEYAELLLTADANQLGDIDFTAHNLAHSEFHAFRSAVISLVTLRQIDIFGVQ